MRAEFYVSGYASAEEESIHRYLFDTDKRTIRDSICHRHREPFLFTEMKNDVYVLHKKNDRYEVSGEVVIYKLEDDNTLTYTGIRVQAGSPTCVVPAVL